MVIVANEPIMLSVVLLNVGMLIVVILNVVAPLRRSLPQFEGQIIDVCLMSVRHISTPKKLDSWSK
jgi:hypothetical protein